MNESGTTLQHLRDEIDAIDTEMHGLIRRRASLVDQIRAVKARDSITTVRPGREADILRALAARHDGRFPFAAVARIWREIIAGITRMEMPEYAVAVHTGGDVPGCWDLARDQFGSATPMTPFATAREVLGEIAANRAIIGVLPYPSEADGDPWWTNLSLQDGVRVSYRLPFTPPDVPATGAAPAEALAVGRIVPETSDHDQALATVETQETVSRAALGSLMERVGLQGKRIASHQNGLWFHLVEIEGYVEDDDPRLTELARLEGVERAVLIGAYAAPIAAPPSREETP